MCSNSFAVSWLKKMACAVTAVVVPIVFAPVDDAYAEAWAFNHFLFNKYVYQLKELILQSHIDATVLFFNRNLLISKFSYSAPKSLTSTLSFFKYLSKCFPHF